ncbi:phage minor head protein [Neisseria perflava]|uniref:phage minor head protein n=1 Tax=Neisseria perflava TaxID=33053 RepID=UPI00209D820F|nr:phage minor head protein [Neisseria perflava]MCP1659333.1 hypothetical protein [Neisseria perflava]
MTEPVIRYNSLIDRAALGHLKSKKLLAGFSHYDVWMQEHAVAFTVAKMMDEDMLADVRDALSRAIAGGTRFDDFQKQLKPYLMAKGWWGEQIMTDPVDGVPKLVQLGSTRRLKTIFETNLATARAASQWKRIQSRKESLPYLKYIPSYAHDKRDSHKQYYNLILPVEHELWSVIFPPNGYGCKCGVRQMSAKKALRERSRDIEENPDGFTDKQKAASKAGKLEDDPHIEWRTFTNPRTGKTVEVPADIIPTFAHNHGDRIGALNTLAAERHGNGFVDKVRELTEAYLAAKLTAPEDTVAVSALPDKVPEKEVKRLTATNTDNNTQDHEARTAAAWQLATGDKLEIFDLAVEKGMKQPDYLIVSDGLERGNWVSLDFMFTEDVKVARLNQYFADTDKNWQGKIRQIQSHLEKADIVPLDMRKLTALNRAKLLTYVLSLPKEQRDKIRLLVKESK